VRFVGVDGFSSGERLERCVSSALGTAAVSAACTAAVAKRCIASGGGQRRKVNATPRERHGVGVVPGNVEELVNSHPQWWVRRWEGRGRRLHPQTHLLGGGRSGVQLGTCCVAPPPQAT
jgi:hypothetical protein